jgi:PKD repeat protein
MNKLFKILSLIIILLSLTACNNEDSVVTAGELEAKYTFVKEIVPGKITFINTSQNADSYLWDFGDGTTSIIKDPVKIFAKTGDYSVMLTAKNSVTGAIQIFSSKVSVFVFAGGLVVNGNFESGTSPWKFGVGDGISPSLLVTEGGNTYYSINVAAAGNPYDVNISQTGITMTEGKTYRLTFDAWSNTSRTVVVGIGLSGDPWTNKSVTKDLTSSVQNFSIDLIANFSNTNSRVIFDMGAFIGRVNIDNVTLKELP